MVALTRVVPTEQGRLVLEFGPGDVRLFDCTPARLTRDRPGPDWAVLSYPEKLKHLTFDAGGVRWPDGKALDAGYLRNGSAPLGEPERAAQQLRVAYRNQAPTPVHPTHHVYFVYVAPFAARPFLIGESINGGHADMGGSTTLGLAELLVRPQWTEHFALSGCDWAVPLLAAEGVEEHTRVDAVVREVCRRADTPDSDVATYAGRVRSGGPRPTAPADRCPA